MMRGKKELMPDLHRRYDTHPYALFGRVPTETCIFAQFHPLHLLQNPIIVIRRLVVLVATLLHPLMPV